MGLGARTFVVIALALASLAVSTACGSRTGLFVPEVSCVFPDDAKIVDLANDTSLAPADYVSLCHISAEQAKAIVNHRRYASAAEVDALPEINAGTCSALIECADNHTKTPCTPNNHPNVVLELVVDESGSMSGAKWEALRDSLLALFDDIAADNDASLSVGIVMFDDVARSAVDPAPLTQSGQLDSLRNAIDKSSPHGGGTGTKRALTTAYKVVNEQTKNNRRAVVLLSDGSPTGGDEEKVECVALVKSENFAQGTQLFAIGIGPFPSPVLTQYDPGFMGHLAEAGATAPKGCDAISENEAEICHYQVTPGGDPTKLKDSFGAALDAIRQSATTCP